MLNTGLIFDFVCKDDKFDKIIKKKLKFNNYSKQYEYCIYSNEFNGDDFFEFLYTITYLRKLHRSYRIPITFDFGETRFSDKLVYIMIETICYYLIREYNQRIFIRCIPRQSIWNEGIFYSSLKMIGDTKAFVSKFEFDLSFRHYRKLLRINTIKDTTLSKLMQDIELFLRNNGIEEEYCYELSEVLIELVGNALEHVKADTLIDVDVTDKYYRKDKTDNSTYYGMNVVIMNYSKTLFQQPLKEKMCTVHNLPSRYDGILQAYKNHQKLFSEQYSENDFFTIASFQDRISGSLVKNTEIGGRGLTSLLKALEERSDTHLCYMLSGNRVLFFKPEYLKNNSDNWVGFNNNNDFINEIPNSTLFQTITPYVPGTAYNLSFAIQKR